MTILMPMRPEIFATYVDAAIAGYAEDNVTSGRWPSAGALHRSRAVFDESLPQGLATPDNFLYEITSAADGSKVGCLWLAIVVSHGHRSAFVYDVEVKPAFRRQGHARAAFKALEPIVRDLGLSSIGLHVFGHNQGAQALYRSLGYSVTSTNMHKSLGESGSSPLPA